MSNCGCINNGLAIEQACPNCHEMRIWVCDLSAKPLSEAMGRPLTVLNSPTEGSQLSKSQREEQLEVEVALKQSENSRLNPDYRRSLPQYNLPTVEDSLRRGFGLPNDPALPLEEGDLD